MRAILRNTGSSRIKQINIPSEIWKEADWNIGDDVELSVECGCEHNKEHNIKEIRIKSLTSNIRQLLRNENG
jgi:bifunctional DNA-binding transcriptional regulator/antitoxin component of YhaV-PrlF toxin-antitoxin module